MHGRAARGKKESTTAYLQLAEDHKENMKNVDALDQNRHFKAKVLCLAKEKTILSIPFAIHRGGSIIVWDCFTVFVQDIMLS